MSGGGGNPRRGSEYLPVAPSFEGVCMCLVVSVGEGRGDFDGGCGYGLGKFLSQRSVGVHI